MNSAPANGIVAGAPELLEALKMARRCIAWCRSSLATTETIIDTAIAKAEGIEIAE
jgi:hypothetical protein